LRTSDRGSAVVEFLLLVLPLVGLAGGTCGVVWYSFAKAQLSQVAAEAAMMAAEPDSSNSEVFASVGENLQNRLGISNFSMSTDRSLDNLSLSLNLPAMEFFGPMAMVFPVLSVVSNVPVEY
jgi:hypothetical protein